MQKNLLVALYLVGPNSKYKTEYFLKLQPSISTFSCFIIALPSSQTAFCTNTSQNVWREDRYYDCCLQMGKQTQGTK